jgi:thioredoxin 1
MKKNTNRWILPLVVGVLCGGAGYYFLKSDKPSTMDCMQHPATNFDEVKPGDVIDVVTVTEETFQVPAPKVEVIEITDAAQLQTLANSEQPAVIKFYAPWCGACNHVESYYKEVAQDFGGKVAFYSVNVDTQGLVDQATALNINKERIEYLPTFVFFQKDKVQEQQTGVIQKEALIEKVKTVFAV